jgi:hypothetical protein
LRFEWLGHKAARLIHAAGAWRRPTILLLHHYTAGAGGSVVIALAAGTAGVALTAGVAGTAGEVGVAGTALTAGVAGTAGVALWAADWPPAAANALELAITTAEAATREAIFFIMGISPELGLLFLFFMV